MAERILVAVDLSETSIFALRTAHALASARGAILAVVHVTPHLVDIQALFPQNYGANMTALAEAEVATGLEVERHVAKLDPGAKVPIFIERGQAYAEIIRRAEAWSASLIVMASHGRTGLARALLGGVAERVVRYAHCPVLVTRQSHSEKVVVAATDLSDPSLPAIVRGAEEARLRGARLVVVHAVDTRGASYLASAGTLFGATVTLPPVDVQRATRDGLSALLRQSMARFSASGESLVLDGAPVAEIVRTVENFHAELLVVGAHGRTGIARIALGSVAEQLVRLSPCSVLAVRVGET
jgi:nucleotide-binding universal stress UspA family protein